MIELLRDHGFDPPTIPEYMTWTSSALKTFRECPRKFYWKYLWRLRSTRPTAAFQMGNAVHSALEWWYTSNTAIPEIVSDAQQVFADEIASAAWFDQNERDKAEKNLQIFRGLMWAYANHYEDDRRRKTKYMGEKQFLIDCGDWDYTGSIDITAIPTDGRPYIIEHKTAGRMDQLYFERLQLDTQTRGYMAGARDGLEIDVGHIEYNVLLKTKIRRRQSESQDEFNVRVFNTYMGEPKKHFARVPLRFTDGDIESFYHEVDSTHAMFEAIANQFDDPLDPRAWGINDHACNNYFRLCGYHGMCTTGLDAITRMGIEQVEHMHMELVE